MLDVIVPHDTYLLISSYIQGSYLVCACEVTKVPVNQLASNLSLRDVNEILIHVLAFVDSTPT